MAEHIVIGKDRLVKKFRALSESVQGLSLARAANGGAVIIRNEARQNIEDQGLERTRQLGKSLHTEVSMKSSAVAEVEIGTNLEYAAIHEFGGTIKPKANKYLAIPVGSYTDSPRNHTDLKLRKTASGTLVLVSPAGQVQYVLKASVTMPARPYLRPAYDNKRQEAIDVTGVIFKQLVEKAALEG